MNKLANLCHDEGDYEQAEPLYYQLLEILKKTPDENQCAYAITLNNLASQYQDQGDFARAESLYRQALEIYKKVVGENNLAYARGLNDLGTLRQDEGDFKQAIPLLVQSLAIRKKVLGENDPAYAGSLNNLAVLYHYTRNYVQAERLYRQVLQILKKAQCENQPRYASTLTRLASQYQDQGDFARAEPLYRQALEIYKNVVGENNPDYAMTLGNLAVLYLTQGDYVQAKPLCYQVLEIRKKSLGTDHPDYANSLGTLALLYENQGDYARAEPLFRQAVEIIRRHIEATSIVQSERQQLAMLETRRYYLDNYVKLAARSERYAAAVYGESLAWKGIVLRRNRLTRAGAQSPELLETFTRLQRVTTQLTRLAWATPDPKQEANWRERTAKLSAEKELLEAQLSARSAEYRQAKRQVTLEEVQAALPQDAVLIDFIEYSHHTPADKKAGTKESRERRLLGFVLGPGCPVEMVPLGPIQPINEAIETWRVTFGILPQGVAAGKSCASGYGSRWRRNSAGRRSSSSRRMVP